MAAKAKVPKFTGALKEPIPYYPMAVALLAHGEDADKQKKIWQTACNDLTKKRAEKLLMLLEYYRIEQSDPNAWLGLAYRLALDFIPGMKIVENARRRGAPPKWPGTDGIELIAGVEKVAKERGKGNSDAIRIMIRRNPGRWGKYSPETLEARYYEVLAQQTRLAQRLK